jgi:thymidylate synthase (FAD)
MTDPYFRVETFRIMPNPQQLVWAAMHQDYSEEFVIDETAKFPNENDAGEIIVRHLLSGNRGHFGPIENAAISFNCGGFPHSVIQQLRTHRTGITFDCQSLRYTGKRFIDVVTGKRSIEEVFYQRPVGHYTDRQGKKYFYSEEQRKADLDWCFEACKRYKQRIEEGLSEEHARGIIPFDFRQHFVMSCNARSLMHILDLRAKADAQLEIQQLCELLMVRFKEWMPQVADWYESNRLGKARLSP